MKSKITLFLVLFILPILTFMGNVAFAQTISGSASSGECLGTGVIKASSTGLGTTPEYQLLKAGVVVYPIPGDPTQFSTVKEFVSLGSGVYTVKGRANATATIVYSSGNITVTDSYVNMNVVAPTKVLSCVGGGTDLTTTVTGGVAPYTYSIALQGSHEPIETSTALTATSYVFGKTVPLPAGTYVISVTDKCGTTSTGASSISSPTITVDDIRFSTTAYFSRTVLTDCESVINVNNEMGFVYRDSGNPITWADASNFTWKLRFQGNYYGKDGVKDGPGFPLGTTKVPVPAIATREAILADESSANPPAIVLMDACGHERALNLVNINKRTSTLTPINCQGTPYVITHAYSGLDCFPMEITFTNAADPTDVVVATAATGNDDILSGFKAGAKYNFTYKDAAGYTSGLWSISSVTIPTSTTFNPAQRTTGVQPNLNRLGYGILNINMPSVLKDQKGTIEVVASSNPATVPIGKIIDNITINTSGYMTVPAVNSGDPAGYWPKGTYTLKVSTSCGSKNIVVNVAGYVASLDGNVITQVCGGFNYIMKANLDDYTAYEVAIVSGPNSVGIFRNFESATTSLPFEGLTPGNYVFGLRIKGGSGSSYVLTQDVDNPAISVIANDKSKTGGYVCDEAGTGTLSISATTKAPAPNDVLKYALSKDGGKTYGDYQSSNAFNGLSFGTYFFRVMDGCGNMITSSSQIGVASTPKASADGISDLLKLCDSSTGTVQLDVNILGASLYVWTGPGITAANKNEKSPLVSIQDLGAGSNDYKCSITLGAPCNTTNEATLTIFKGVKPAVVINNPTVCSPDKIDLTALSVTKNSDEGLTYSYFTNSTATTVLSNPTEISATGTYYIKATNGNCDVIVPVIATVNPLPVAAIAYSGQYCNRGVASVTQTGVSGGSYTGDSGLKIDAAKGLIDLTASSAGTHTVTYTFSDGKCSNTTETTIIINATTLPAILQPVTEQCSVTAITAPKLQDFCGGTITAKTTTIFPITKAGETDVIWVFDYGNGYTQSVVQKVYIDDTIAPVLVGSLKDINEECSATPEKPTATDNCDSGIIRGTTTTLFPITKQGLTEVLWRFEDSSGNFSTATQNVFIKDVTAPVIPILGDIKGECSVTPQIPTTTDNCAGSISGTTDTMFPITKVGETIITWTFDDSNGNVVTADQKVIITNVAMVGSASTLCAVNGSGYVLTVNVSGEAPFTATGTGAPGTWSGTQWTSEKIPAGTNYNVSIQDKNACNTLVVADNAPVCCVFEVVAPTFKDTAITCYDQLPVATSLTKAEFETLGNGDGTIGDFPCGIIEITASNSPDPGCNGNIVRTYTVTEYEDTNNNQVRDLGEDTIFDSITFTQTFVIEKADFVMPVNAGETVACPASVKDPVLPEVKDNCGNILTAGTPEISPLPSCNGDVTYTYTFTDCTGNAHDWVYTYTIDNTVAPTGKAPADLVLQCIDDVPAANKNAVTDAVVNCNREVEITVVDTNNGGKGCKGDPYIVTRTFTLTDCGGLTTNLVQKITVEDTTAPIFVEELPVNLLVDCAGEIPEAATLTATDNCSTANVAYEEVKVNGSCSGNYELHRTWTATDSCGNETTHTQIVTVVDTTAPVFVESLPEAVVNATCETIPSVQTLTATDSCGTAAVEYTEVKVDGYCSSKYDLIRTWVASDDCGNQNTFTQTIHVSCLPKIYNAISPNGDGLNDTFTIEGIDCYPNNYLRIYNRYGVLVYDKEGYDNVTNPFEGFSDGRATLKRSDKLPTGTYFYTLEYNDDNNKRVEKSGYLYINNN